MTPYLLLLKVLSVFPLAADGWTSPLTRTQITRRFSPHAGRTGAVAAETIYSDWIPALVRAGTAQLIPRPGKPDAFLFRLMTPPKLAKRLKDVGTERQLINSDPTSFVIAPGQHPTLTSEARLMLSVNKTNGEALSALFIHSVKRSDTRSMKILAGQHSAGQFRAAPTA